MNTVGYWKSPTFPFLPDPHVYVDPDWDRAERDAVVWYLSEGRIRYAHLRGNICAICGGTFGHNDLTDGTWIWPEDLVHYLVTHNVRPDQLFIDWALQRAAAD